MYFVWIIFINLLLCSLAEVRVYESEGQLSKFQTGHAHPKRYYASINYRTSVGHVIHALMKKDGGIYLTLDPGVDYGSMMHQLPCLIHNTPVLSVLRDYPLTFFYESRVALFRDGSNCRSLFTADKRILKLVDEVIYSSMRGTFFDVHLDTLLNYDSTHLQVLLAKFTVSEQKDHARKLRDFANNIYSLRFDPREMFDADQGQKIYTLLYHLRQAYQTSSGKHVDLFQQLLRITYRFNLFRIHGYSSRGSEVVVNSELRNGSMLQMKLHRAPNAVYIYLPGFCRESDAGFSVDT